MKRKLQRSLANPNHRMRIVVGKILRTGTPRQLRDMRDVFEEKFGVTLDVRFRFHPDMNVSRRRMIKRILGAKRKYVS